MKNFSTWMLVLFMIMFWVFRVIVVLMDELNLDFGGIEPLNASLEIILCFVVFVCIILVVKRKMIGGLLYLLSYTRTISLKLHQFVCAFAHRILFFYTLVQIQHDTCNSTSCVLNYSCHTCWLSPCVKILRPGRRLHFNTRSFSSQR